jgi:hypothetical protein
MTPPEKNVLRRVGKMTQGGLYPHLERQGLIEAKAAGELSALRVHAAVSRSKSRRILRDILADGKSIFVLPAPSLRTPFRLPAGLPQHGPDRNREIVDLKEIIPSGGNGFRGQSEIVP